MTEFLFILFACIVIRFWGFVNETEIIVDESLPDEKQQKSKEVKIFIKEYSGNKLLETRYIMVHVVVSYLTKKRSNCNFAYHWKYYVSAFFPISQ
jgi:hypothetical protein